MQKQTSFDDLNNLFKFPTTEAAKIQNLYEVNMVDYDPKKTESLNLPFSVGVLFFNKISPSNKKSQPLYGFYQKRKGGKQGEEYFLYEETLVSQASN